VLPHVVQNWAEPGRTDRDVRKWCRQHAALYQPYAPLRNLRFLPRPLQQALRDIAGGHGASEQAVALQFFLQAGAMGIPRSTQRAHLAENLRQPDWRLSEEEMRVLEGEDL
jgi:diketogulonate reductase-like aldo/keto reductase